MAPAIVALVWANLFERFEPLDAEALFDAHLALLMRALQGERRMKGAIRLILVLIAARRRRRGRLLALRPHGGAAGRLSGLYGGLPRLHGAEEGGRIVAAKAEPGDRVQPGQFLFALDPCVQEAQKREAEARLHQCGRSSPISKARCSGRSRSPSSRRRRSARRRSSTIRAATSTARRRCSCAAYTAQARLDQAESAFERDKAALAEVQRLIAAGEIAGRQGEIGAAEAAMRVAEADLAQAETRLAKRRVSAETAGVVQDVFFRPGEVVIAGQPVLSLLPPGNRRIRFYVPEPVLATLALGAPVAVTCDSCPADLGGKVSFIAQEAEYTPPVIFSREERRKLVFRVEAQLSGDAALPLGLPVTVLPTGAPR